MAKVTTGTGDSGYTSLLGDQRVAKYDPLPETFGTIDEATSALGLARATTTDETARETILHLQGDLYLMMGELATPAQHQAAVGLRMTAEHVRWLEEREEALKAAVEIPNRFVIPGDSVDGAALDLARTIIRRAERMVARLAHDGVITNAEVLRYLNRSSDLVFILARYLEAKQGGSTLAPRPARASKGGSPA
ncbi:MAG TPA: cob(I)yrinic acid a,c-diamide adenosyltransferase [Ktedonobacterales bacterium]